VVPLGTRGLTGVTAMAARVADVTVSVAVPFLPDTVALIFAVPVLRVVAIPWLPAEFETVATAAVALAHVATGVRSIVVPSE